MALPSQYVATSSRRSNMYRRSGRRRVRRWIGIGGAVAVTAVVIWWFRPAGDPAPDGDPGNGQVAALTPDRGDVAPATPPATSAAGSGAASDPDAQRDRDGETAAREPAPSRPAEAVARPEPRAPRGSARPADAWDPTAEQAAANAEARWMLAELEESKVAMREELSRLLLEQRLHPDDAATVRARLAEVNEQLVFSSQIVQGDPFSVRHTLTGSDRLSRMPRTYDWKVDWTFLAHVNRMSNPNRIVAGRSFKGVTGPFHAVVTKRSHRIDLWMGDPVAGPLVFVRSFDVGIGADDRTPVGRFAVTTTTPNPGWTSEDGQQTFAPDDPENPIGEYWIGIVGDDPEDLAIDGLTGFGIHGTIEPASIGGNESLGCVRLRDGEIDLVYGMLRRGSIVVIRERDVDPFRFAR